MSTEVPESKRCMAINAIGRCRGERGHEAAKINHDFPPPPGMASKSVTAAPPPAKPAAAPRPAPAPAPTPAPAPAPAPVPVAEPIAEEAAVEAETVEETARPAPQPASSSTAVTVARKAPLELTNRGVQIANIDQLYRIASWIAMSEFVPKGMEKPETIAIAIQYGLELGLTPMAALQNIAVINKRPALWGDAVKGLVEGSGLLEDFDEWYELEDGNRVAALPSKAKVGDDCRAVCMVKRANRRELVRTFSVGDAKAAGLWGKEGPWQSYYQRMLSARARTFALRDGFPDILKGLYTAEELRDGSIETELADSDTPIAMPTEN